MNYQKLDKVEKSNRRKALFVTFFIHFALLGGLYYVNTDDPMAIVPDFVMEWFDGNSMETEEIVVAKSKKP